MSNPNHDEQGRFSGAGKLRETIKGAVSTDKSKRFEEAKAQRDKLWAEMEKHSAALKVFPKTGPMGLISDDVRASPSFKTAKANYDRSCNNLRNFNSTFTKEFKNELEEERHNRKPKE